MVGWGPGGLTAGRMMVGMNFTGSLGAEFAPILVIIVGAAGVGLMFWRFRKGPRL